jgi:hypothetical protein
MGPVAIAAALAVAATVLLYRPTLEYGFHYDDYHFIRPYSAGELRAAFRGPWDSSGIELPFYRPLTVAFYAARFEWFGLEARAHHALSLALFSLAALLLGTFVSGVSRRRWTGTLAVLLFVAHPSMPYALAAWITNQMHLVETIVVLLALVWWWWVARMAGGCRCCCSGPRRFSSRKMGSCCSHPSWRCTGCTGASSNRPRGRFP